MPARVTNHNYTPALIDVGKPRLLHVGKYDDGVDKLPSRMLHRHNNCMEMIFVRSGTGCYAVDGIPYDVEKGSLVIYNCNVVHERLPAFDDHLSIYCLALTGLQLPGLQRNCLIAENQRPVMSCAPQYEAIVTLFELMHTVLIGDAYDAEQSSHYLMLSLLAILLNRIEMLSMKESVMAPNTWSFGKSIKHYIDEHFTESLSLQSLGEALNVSPYYLSHIFKECTGFSPMQYVTKRRLGEAQELLLNTSLSITNIAQTVGYQNISSFNYVFAKHIRMSPSQYREDFGDRKVIPPPQSRESRLW